MIGYIKTKTKPNQAKTQKQKQVENKDGQRGIRMKVDERYTKAKPLEGDRSDLGEDDGARGKAVDVGIEGESRVSLDHCMNFEYQQERRISLFGGNLKHHMSVVRYDSH